MSLPAIPAKGMRQQDNGLVQTVEQAAELAAVSAASKERAEIESAMIIAKRMREVAMTVVFTRVPADIDFAQLTPRVDFVVDAVTPVAWRHVLCAAKWDALPRVIRDSDYLVDDEGARTGLHAR